MIKIDVPGFRNLELNHLVLDYNGTLAEDGMLLPNVGNALVELAKDITIHVITADTFGHAASQLEGLPLKLIIIPAEKQADEKLAFISRLGVDSVIGIGNGRNDCKMLKAAALGIAVLQKEGGSAETIASADIVSLNILDAIELLRKPKRLIATLRS